MKTARGVFIVLFLAAITIPVVFIDRTSVISMLERRMLANPPRVHNGGKLDIKLLEMLPKQIDTYITDRFAGRSRLIYFMNHVNYFILQKSHDNRLLVGKDRWLFYIDKGIGDEFANYYKTNLFNSEQMENFLWTLGLTTAFCRENGIKFVFLIVPDKCSVYPEKYLSPRPEGPSLADQVMNAMPQDWRENIIFPRDYFISKKDEHAQPLYFNNGLHWTKLGVFYAYGLLYDKLKPAFPNLPEIELQFTPYMDTGEDNYALWWGIRKFSPVMELLDVKPVDGWEGHYRYIKSENVPLQYNRKESVDAMRGKYGMITENVDQSLPTAVVIRDSYFVALEPFTSSLFSKTEYIWTEPEKRSVDYLAQMPEKPDVLIWEIGERGLQAIPLMPRGHYPTD
ncbi:hypothetical protein AGMMS50267_10120 [Spirochaetia bacterium]|nr:hypothetical protein AGMMS50267_10120 [Spirochaetia bacterium]